METNTHFVTSKRADEVPGLVGPMRLVEIMKFDTVKGDYSSRSNLAPTNDKKYTNVNVAKRYVIN